MRRGPAEDGARARARCRRGRAAPDGVLVSSSRAAAASVRTKPATSPAPGSSAVTAEPTNRVETVGMTRMGVDPPIRLRMRSVPASAHPVRLGRHGGTADRGMSVPNVRDRQLSPDPTARRMQGGRTGSSGSGMVCRFPDPGRRKERIDGNPEGR